MKTNYTIKVWDGNSPSAGAVSETAMAKRFPQALRIAKRLLSETISDYPLVEIWQGKKLRGAL